MKEGVAGFVLTDCVPCLLCAVAWRVLVWSCRVVSCLGAPPPRFLPCSVTSVVAFVGLLSSRRVRHRLHTHTHTNVHKRVYMYTHVHIQVSELLKGDKGMASEMSLSNDEIEMVTWQVELFVPCLDVNCCAECGHVTSVPKSRACTHVATSGAVHACHPSTSSCELSRACTHVCKASVHGMQGVQGMSFMSVIHVMSFMSPCLAQCECLKV